MFMRRRRPFATLVALYSYRSAYTCKDVNMTATSSRAKGYIYSLLSFPEARRREFHGSRRRAFSRFQGCEKGFVKLMGIVETIYCANHPRKAQHIVRVR